jgi:HPt (histidine-containing phosphotransfer) domain-containing protein
MKSTKSSRSDMIRLKDARNMTFHHETSLSHMKAEFDSEDLLERIEGDRSLFKEVVRIFMEDTPGLIHSLGEGISKGNLDTVEKMAHAIKGSCAMISAKRLEGLAHQLEKMGRNGNLDGAETVYQNVIERFNGLKQIIMSHLEQMDSSR